MSTKLVNYETAGFFTVEAHLSQVFCIQGERILTER